MSKEKYLAYIAYFVENIATSTTKHEWRQYLSKSSVLGDHLFAADEDKIKKLARHLYRSYVLSHFSRHRVFVIVSSLTDKQIEEYLQAVLDLDKKYGLDYNTIHTDVDQKSVDKAIGKIEFARYKSVLTKLDPKNSPTKIKAEASEKRAKAKEARLAKSGTTKKSATKRSPITRKTSTKKVTKSCNDHNLKELKEMAKEKGIVGYSKMNKPDLCKLLKLK